MVAMMYKGFKNREEYLSILETVCSNAWVGVLIADKKGNYVYSNKIYEDLTGFSNQMICELNAQDLADKYIDSGKSSTMLVLKEKKEIVMQQHLVPQDKHILVKAFPIFDENSDINYVVSYVLDVTKTQRIKDEVEQARIEKEAVYIEALKLRELESSQVEEFMVYKSKKMADVVETIKFMGQSNATVLILGESGTGKEMVAKYIHNNSHRKNNRFVKINCSSIPESLLESELFGYESGTFTGGKKEGKIGILEYANHGTVLLDEIGDMPMGLQAKILRVLQEKEIQKVGGHETIQLDIRFIAATNIDIQTLVGEKKFREDLYYRLNVIPLKVPSLKERREDIPLLISYFLNQYNYKYSKDKSVCAELIKHLRLSNLQGNVRELRNIIERLVLLAPGSEISIRDYKKFCEDIDDHEESDLIQDNTMKDLLNNYEKKIISYYAEKKMNTYEIAQKLSVNQSTIHRKMKKHKLL